MNVIMIMLMISGSANDKDVVFSPIFASLPTLLSMISALDLQEDVMLPAEMMVAALLTPDLWLQVCSSQCSGKCVCKSGYSGKGCAGLIRII